MQATLQILTGPETGRSIYLKSGQMARFGRTEWSDFAFPYDHRLADVHFSIETASDAVTLVDLSDGKGVQVDGEKQSTCQLHNGQKIKAGSMIFAIVTELQFDTSGAGPIAHSRPAATGRTIALAHEVCADVELSESAQTRLDQKIEVLPFIELLTGEDLLLDALRVLASWLGKRKAVWWGADCIESACSEWLEPQADLLGRVRVWVDQPTEENRRAALDAADTADTKLPACWLARAAGWSGGSLSPAGLPIVPPDEQLTAQALVGSLLLAAVLVDPSKCADNYRQFIEQGKQLSQTQLDWETRSDTG